MNEQHEVAEQSPAIDDGPETAGTAAAVPQGTYPLRVVDIMACIADAYTTFLMRPASFPELVWHYERVEAGRDLNAILKEIAESEESVQLALTQSRRVPVSENIPQLIRYLYPIALRRPASQAETRVWVDRVVNGSSVSDIVVDICGSEEAGAKRKVADFAGHSDVRFVQLVLELVAGRGASVSDIARYEAYLLTQPRADLIAEVFQEASKGVLAPVTAAAPEPRLFGRSAPLDPRDWSTANVATPPQPGKKWARYPFKPRRDHRPIVTIITSLYEAGEYIECFLQNITSQSIFKTDCELIIIDAASPGQEAMAIARYAHEFPNIVYERSPTRIGIYAAWNLALRKARGHYVTNANVDDCRRSDSIEQQAAALQALPFVDVVYQDVFYSLEANLAFAAIESHGLKTDLPNVSAYNLMEHNMPHNAPMWRRALHDDVGDFDEGLRSAGDWDFWLRCKIKAKTFYKLNDAHVAYYFNPTGLSTRPDTRGGEEMRLISKRNFRALTAPELALPRQDFDRLLEPFGIEARPDLPRYDRVQEALCGLGSTSRP